MKVQLYDGPHNWFQYGWNMAVANPQSTPIPTCLDMFKLHDYIAGMVAVFYKKSLPESWLY